MRKIVLCIFVGVAIFIGALVTLWGSGTYPHTKVTIGLGYALTFGVSTFLGGKTGPFHESHSSGARSFWMALIVSSVILHAVTFGIPEIPGIDHNDIKLMYHLLLSSAGSAFALGCLYYHLVGYSKMSR